MSSMLALASAAVFGAADFAGGYASRRLPTTTVTLISNLVGAALAGVLVVLFGGSWSSATIGWGVAAGVVGLVGLLALYGGLASGPNRLVSPLSGVVAAVIPVIAGIVAGERPGTAAIIGLALTPVAIWLVTGGDVRGAQRRALGYGLVAGLGFGWFFVCLDQAPDDAGAAPLLAARCASVVILVAIALRVRPRVGSLHDVRLPALAGLLDMTANGLFLWATLDGDLSVVGALVNLFPVPTVLLAVWLLHERLTRTQAAGIALAVGSAVLLA